MSLPSDNVLMSLCLAPLCPEAAACYEQALQDLVQRPRLSWRGPAAELREALREVLDKLAPDEDVRNSPGFRVEANTSRPTMKQKARFILKSRDWPRNSMKVTETAVETVEEKVGALVRSVYGRSSGSVHVSQDEQEVVAVKRYVEAVLADLLEVRE